MPTVTLDDLHDLYMHWIILQQFDIYKNSDIDKLKYVQCCAFDFSYISEYFENPKPIEEFTEQDCRNFEYAAEYLYKLYPEANQILQSYYDAIPLYIKRDAHESVERRAAPRSGRRRPRSRFRVFRNFIQQWLF
jgi:hypothetical protein